MELVVRLQKGFKTQRLEDLYCMLLNIYMQVNSDSLFDSYVSTCKCAIENRYLIIK